ncbi:hypothetical protein KC19_VG326700 [Ceratodon purpureus]|uniref:Uncharacterized protein n=1 Tax=Ceratodon purpureus TaxID=3225 RepID=A0A8T0HVY4_CERPU|nr:hypothetical protein KC19_VG326700 [Ceratodon purpureus]
MSPFRRAKAAPTHTNASQQLKPRFSAKRKFRAESPRSRHTSLRRPSTPPNPLLTHPWRAKTAIEVAETPGCSVGEGSCQRNSPRGENEIAPSRIGSCRWAEGRTECIRGVRVRQGKVEMKHPCTAGCGQASARRVDRR